MYASHTSSMVNVLTSLRPDREEHIPVIFEVHMPTGHALAPSEGGQRLPVKPFGNDLTIASTKWLLLKLKRGTTTHLALGRVYVRGTPLQESASGFHGGQKSSWHGQ